MKIDINWYRPDCSDFKISTAEQLLALSSIVASNGGVVPHDTFAGKTIELVSDIDLSSIGNEWQAIGTNDFPFDGTFIGNKHTISGLKVGNNVSNNGIFGFASIDAQIKNLTVKAEFYESQTAGGIVAVNSGNITGCRFYGTIIGYYSIGGIVGVNNGVISRCANYANVVSKNQYAGGIVGVNKNDIGEISDSYNNGTISGVNCVGGITGHNSGTQIKNCFNRGEISAFSGYSNAECIGGVSGYNAEGCPIKNCYSRADIRGGKFTGGIVGKNLGTLTGCFNKGVVVGTVSVGGITGVNYNGQLETCRNGGNVSGKAQIGGISGENQGGFIQNCNNSGAVDGSSGLIGGLVGVGKWGQINSSSNDGVVRNQGDEKVGGIIGEIKYGNIKNCTNTGAVVGIQKVGGIAGSSINRSSITDSSNTGEIRGNSLVGGLVGYAYGDTKDSYNTGTVYGFETFSNLVGFVASGATTDCYSTGKIVNINE